MDVVTSENSAAFYAERLRLTPEPAAAPPAPEGAALGEPASESVPETPDEPPEKEAEGQQTTSDPEATQRRNQRFSDLTKARDEAKARADKAEADAKAALEAKTQAERRAAELQAKYEPPKSEELGPKPELAQFVNVDEYSKALEDWAAEKGVREKETRDAQERMARAWSERQKATIAELPDYEATITASANLVVSNEVKDAIVDSEAGPKILYHLAKNPELVAELAKDSRATALRKIGRLEAKFLDAKAPESPAAGAKEPDKPAVAATEISRAPAPITPLKGAGAPIEPPVNPQGEFVGTFADWKRLRKEGKIR